MSIILIIVFLGLLSLPQQTASSQTQVRVGSKKFTESVILGELVAKLAENSGVEVQHIKQLGGTRVLWKALIKGEIDVYPEYTGTIKEEIFFNSTIGGFDELSGLLQQSGILISRPLGFNNTYALGVKAETAQRLGLEKISDLNLHPDLVLAFSNEFMDRADGWPGLRDWYSMPHRNVSGIDHDLAYRGLESGDIDVIDLYSTDAEIRYYGIKPLLDDRGFFPRYDAVLLYRADLLERSADFVSAIERLEGAISEQDMVELNSLVKLGGTEEGLAASRFLEKKFEIKSNYSESTFFSRLWKNTAQHLVLVLSSLTAAILISIPLGIAAVYNDRVGQFVLAVTGIIQTIPSLALLVFMIPFLGIGTLPAIVALFLYSLLPIVRNTYSGLKDIPTGIKESAHALGLPRGAVLRLVELPLATRSILSGIKTSAVINIGTATLGALIGAGGYGQPILTGIRLDDTGLILQGAVPAALLALGVQGVFELVERTMLPKGL